ncbi:MAG TPA: cupin domain-containing protein [Anaerolineales bacterium]|jgi:mannose-6-phosphate isomerase-like protein (cupin superfamily)|nr:cupin domain-containing protein [Anaerolineales bacterium]
MQAFQLHELENLATEEKRPYFEFLRVPALSMGLYRMIAGQPDPQSPHKQDEVYYVLSGRAKLDVNGQIADAVPGSLLYVEANAPHKFVAIEEDLEVLVFFAPAES